MQPTDPLPAWYFDELRMAGVDFNHPSQSETYDVKQFSSRPELEQVLVKRLDILPGHVVADLGAGTGTFAIEAARAGAIVYAVDISQAMLSYAQRKAGDVSNIHFHQAGFLTYQHTGDPVDLVVTKFALHILPDFWKVVALTRIIKLLKPGGLFYLKDVIFSFPPEQYETAIAEWIDRVAKPEGQGWTRADYEMHMRDEHSTFTWLMEPMLTQAGFEILESTTQSPTLAEYLCRKPYQTSIPQ